MTEAVETELCQRYQIYLNFIRIDLRYYSCSSAGQVWLRGPCRMPKQVTGLLNPLFVEKKGQNKSKLKID